MKRHHGLHRQSFHRHSVSRKCQNFYFWANLFFEFAKTVPKMYGIRSVLPAPLAKPSLGGVFRAQPYLIQPSSFSLLISSQLDTHLFQLITDQPAVLVHIQVFEHGVHQRPLLLHVPLLALFVSLQHFGLHIQQHALQLVVLRHGARIT